MGCREGIVSMSWAVADRWTTSLLLNLEEETVPCLFALELPQCAGFDIFQTPNFVLMVHLYLLIPKRLEHRDPTRMVVYP